MKAVSQFHERHVPYPGLLRSQEHDLSMLGRLVSQRIVLLVRAGIGLARHQPADISGERIALGQRADLDPPAALRADIAIAGGKAGPGGIDVTRPRPFEPDDPEIVAAVDTHPPLPGGRPRPTRP